MTFAVSTQVVYDALKDAGNNDQKRAKLKDLAEDCNNKNQVAFKLLNEYVSQQEQLGQKFTFDAKGIEALDAAIDGNSDDEQIHFSSDLISSVAKKGHSNLEIDPEHQGFFDNPPGLILSRKLMVKVDKPNMRPNPKVPGYYNDGSLITQDDLVNGYGFTAGDAQMINDQQFKRAKLSEEKATEDTWIELRHEMAKDDIKIEMKPTQTILDGKPFDAKLYGERLDSAFNVYKAEFQKHNAD